MDNLLFISIATAVGIIVGRLTSPKASPPTDWYIMTVDAKLRVMELANGNIEHYKEMAKVLWNEGG